MNTASSSLNPIDSKRGDVARVSVLHCQGYYLSLGLTWFALVGSNPRKSIYQLARSLQATHFVLAGSGARVAACGRLTRHKQVAFVGNNKIRHYSLAALFAVAHPDGARACLLPDSEGGSWLIASNEGHVLCSTDRYFPSRHAVEQAIADIQIRYPSLILITLGPEWEEHLPGWLTGSPPESAALKPIPRWRVLSLGALVLFVGTVLVGTSLLWLMSNQARSRLDSNVAGPTDSWGHIQTNSTLPQPVVDKSGSLWSSIQGWATLPVQKEGWRLQSIECRTVEAAWQCEARYQRYLPWARRQHLEQLNLSNPVLSFDNMRQAVLHWTSPRAVEELVPDPSTATYWLDQLQDIESGFELLELGPADTRIQHKMRTLHLRGPLRSALLINKVTAPITWQRVSISHRALPPGQAGVTRSAVEFVAEGDIYVE